MDEIARLFWPYVKKVWADPELRKEAIIAKMHWKRIDAMQKATGKGKARRAIRFKMKKQIQEVEKKGII